MEFTVEFYEAQSGRCPVREFLDRLKESDPDDFAIVMAGLAKLRNRQYHKPPLSKPIGKDLFEMRHVGKLNTKGALFLCRGAEDDCSPWDTKQRPKNFRAGY